LQNGCSVKTRTRLYPFFGFYLAVTVEVGAEVAMPAEAAAGIIAQQQHDEYPQRVFLKIGAGIGRMPPLVQPALVTNTDTVSVMAFGMRPGTFQRPERLYITVPADIIVITCAGESPAQVVCGQLMFGIATVATGSGTMNDDEVDKSHFL
jgi:hypothetical protein